MELLLWEQRLAAAAEELEAWAASVEGVETVWKGDPAEASWATDPGVSLQRGLQEGVLRGEDLSKEKEPNMRLILSKPSRSLQIFYCK